MIKKDIKYNILKEYNNVCLNYNTSPSLNREDFHQFINGLYQAEGTMGAYFPKENSLSIRFYFSIGQNYSSEALKVFLILRKVLNVGNVKLEFNSKDQPHIRYTVSNTKHIMVKVLPYFSLLYGQKKRDRVVLEIIYRISLEILKEIEPKPYLVCEFINQVYSINPEGKERKLSLLDKLKLFNCSSLAFNNDIDVEENNNLPSKLFIIGLFLGDGTFGFVFDSPLMRAPNFYVKIIFNFAAQSNRDSNIKLLELVAKSMDLKPQIYINKSGMVGLQYTGEIVFKSIIPFLIEYKD